MNAKITKNTIINTDHVLPPQVSSNINDTRKSIYENTCDNSITIFVLCYNRLDKTKRCVESILKFTQDIDYKLALIDNGSSDGTAEYFEQLDHPKKHIITITKNIGAAFGMNQSFQNFDGKYYVFIVNDIVVTKNWLSNLLSCIDSDEKIGFVVPVSSNVSNLQEVNLNFKGYDDMQHKAAKFNQGNPKKWEERMRLISIGVLLKKEVIDAVGAFDLGYFHDFLEDDYCARVRRAGYKLMLCKDTFIHHDHDFRNMEGKDPVQFQQSLETGRKNYSDKFMGIDAWDDINNFELNLIALLDKEKPTHTVTPTILGMDIRCGSPILEIRNYLRRNGITKSESFAFTTEAKYFNELQFVTDNKVMCDRIEYFYSAYPDAKFDYIILGEPINTYPKPIALLEQILAKVRKNGRMLIKLRNTLDVRAFLRLVGQNQPIDGDMPIHISKEDFCACLNALGASKLAEGVEGLNVPQDTGTQLLKAISNVGASKDPKSTLNRMLVSDYLFCIKK